MIANHTEGSTEPDRAIGSPSRRTVIVHAIHGEICRSTSPSARSPGERHELPWHSTSPSALYERSCAAALLPAGLTQNEATSSGRRMVIKTHHPHADGRIDLRRCRTGSVRCLEARDRGDMPNRPARPPSWTQRRGCPSLEGNNVLIGRPSAGPKGWRWISTSPDTTRGHAVLPPRLHRASGAAIISPRLQSTNGIAAERRDRHTLEEPR
jgi:hypothetical protein